MHSRGSFSGKTIDERVLPYGERRGSRGARADLNVVLAQLLN